MSNITIPVHSKHDASYQGIVQAYRRMMVWRVCVLGTLAVLCVAALVFDLTTGPSALLRWQVVRALLGFDAELTGPQSIIIFQLRLPQALMAFLVGAALSLAGAEMQTILNNPLASPFTLGVSSAASFGAALAIILGFSLPFISPDWMVPLNAFLCAFGSVLLLEAVSRRRAAGVNTVVLFGIALVFTFNALVAFIQFIASQAALQQLIFWSMGSMSRANWTSVWAMLIVIAVLIPFSMRAARGMNALRLGEDRARSFGVNVARLRFLSLMRISLLAGTAVAFVGTIGFIGLVGPHIARLLLGEDHRFLLPASMLTGGLIMSLASAMSKALVPGVLLPVGIVTSIVGVPIFILLIFRRHHRV